MGVLNKRGLVVLALAVGLLSLVINFWVAQRQSGAASAPQSAVKEAAMSHPLPGEQTPPGIPMTPISPGSPIATLSPGKPITTVSGE